MTRVFSRFPDHDELTVTCALHQAGHVLAGVNEGLAISHADLLGCAGVSSWHMPLVEPEKRVTLDSLVTTCRLPERMAAFRLGGPVALQLLSCDVMHDASCGEDAVGARNLLRPFLESEAELEAAMRRIEARVSAMLMYRLESLYQLAGAFLQYLVLTPADIQRELKKVDSNFA